MASRNPRSNSTQLDRTLKELENAFADWENLSGSSGGSAGHGKSKEGATSKESEEEKRKAKAAEQSATEFQKRTQKLLDQLRQQIAELNE